METKTQKFDLIKPDPNDFYDINIQNQNMDIIDEELGNKLDVEGDASNTTVTFSQANTRENLVTGEKSSTLIGKIMKWFFDLKAIVFSGSANDLTDPNSHANIGSSIDDSQSLINTKIDIAIGTKEPKITSGTTSQYWKGNKTWSDLATDVRAVLLTGLLTVTNAAISATDTILSAIGKLQAQINTKENSSNKGIANGYASLDSNAKVPLSQINDALLGNVSYQGVWNASTNTPTLPSTPSSKGIYYIVSVAGTQFSKSFEVGDWIISNGISWDKVDNTDAVSSVAGRTGNVVLNTGDVIDPNSHANIGSSANDTQSTINTKMDTAIGNKLDKTGDASNTVNTFSQAGTRANLTTGEKTSVSLGKLMKLFADLKAVAFSGSTSDLADPNAHANIGSSAGNSQTAINANIDTVIGLKEQLNYLINGGFDVWQDGSTFNTSAWTADMWYAYQYISTMAVGKQAFPAGQVAVPNNPRNYLQIGVTGVAGGDSQVVLFQKIEDVTRLSGKTFTLSFWCSADSSKNISIEAAQVFGVGGSAMVSNIGVTKQAVGAGWQRVTATITFPSISGKTLGTGHYSQITIWLCAGTNLNARTNTLGIQSGTFCFANFSLVEGTVAQEWQNENVNDVLIQCQRYYEKSYDLNTPPKTINNNNGAATLSSNANAYGGDVQVQFKVRKRATPVVNTYDFDGNYGTGTTARYWIVALGSYGNGALSSIGETGFAMTFYTSHNNTKQFHWTADSRL
jgi:hypothetical protein